MTYTLDPIKSAQEVLSDNFISEPPVTVIDLVKNYGYRVKDSSLPAEFAGLIEPKKNVFFINHYDVYYNKAYTIAYLLGLVVMYEPEIEKKPQLAILSHHPIGKETQVEMFDNAHIFARNLLVPLPIFKKTLSKFRSFASIDTLSKIFGVSKELVQIQINQISG